MTTDIERAREAKLRAVRRAARAAYWDRLSISFHVSWPGGVLGWTCGVLLMLTPQAIVALAVWIWLRDKRRSSTDGATWRGGRGRGSQRLGVAPAWYRAVAGTEKVNHGFIFSGPGTGVVPQEQQ